MSSAREFVTVRGLDTIELESDPDNHEREISICTSGNDLTVSVDDTTSSILSDSTENSTIDCNSKLD